MGVPDRARARASGFQAFRMWMVSCFLSLMAVPALADTPVLSFPLRCTLHEICFIQNYMDIDPSSAAKDYRCKEAVYDGHKGTDFRVLSVRQAKKGVTVVAAAAGTVKALRDGMADRLVGKGVEVPEGRECGNGVLIDHGAGWQTQYCHMRRGSVRVRKGQQVKRGEPIGLVGYSGKAQFAHLHLSVRHEGRVIDPFTGSGVDGMCGGSAKEALWQPGIGDMLRYRRGELIETGFAAAPVSTRDLEEGRAGSASLTPGSKAIVFYARFINLEKGDRVRLALEGPSGAMAQNTSKPLERHKAQYVTYAGRKLRGKRWPAGRYRGRIQLLRSGKVMLEQEAALELR